MALGLRTEVKSAAVVGRGDLELVGVRPLPSQQRVLQAFARLGFPFKSAALREGRLNHGQQELPFHQKIEFYPPGHHVGAVHEVALAFVSSSSGLRVVLEADRVPGRYPFGEGCFQLTHEEALHTDWPSAIDRWLEGLIHHVRRGGRK